MATIDQLPVQIPRVAWTGGTAPAPWRDTHRRERALVRATFRESMQAMIEFWAEWADDGIGLDTARFHWNRARHDAHASIRHACRIGLDRGTP